MDRWEGGMGGGEHEEILRTLCFFLHTDVSGTSSCHHMGILFQLERCVLRYLAA